MALREDVHKAGITSFASLPGDSYEYRIDYEHAQGSVWLKSVATEREWCARALAICRSRSLPSRSRALERQSSVASTTAYQLFVRMRVCALTVCRYCAIDNRAVFAENQVYRDQFTMEMTLLEVCVCMCVDAHRA